MPLNLRRIRKSIPIFLLLSSPAWIFAQEAEIPVANGSEAGERLVLRDESIDQVLALLERLTGRSIIRPQALPTPTFTFTSQRPMTRQEMVMAIQSMLSINGIGVAPMGDSFLRVVPLQQIRQQAPEFLSEPASNLPPSGRVVSRLLELNFLRIPEVQAQLNLLLSQPGGSMIPFEKSNSVLVTDTISNIQAMEALLARVDVPSLPKTETKFFPIRYGQAGEIVSQIQTFASGPGGLELGSGTVLTADERTNQIIVVADPRQMVFFENFIQKLDIQAELMTRNEVLYLKHANAADVASLLTQLVTGSRTGSSSGVGSGSRNTSGGSGQNRSGIGTQRGRQQGSQQGSQQSQRQQTSGGRQQPQQNRNRVPTIPGMNVNAQSADVEALQAEGGTGSVAEAVQSVLTEAAETDFSETLTILADERSNAIIISGTKQDISMVTELIEKIDVILAQVRIEVFIAEVTLSNNEGRGIDALGITYSENGDVLGFTASGPGWEIGRSADLNWEAVLGQAASRSNVEVLSVPAIVTTHNQEATILVGERRPIITGTLSDGQFSGSTIRSQISYENIGIELVVLPLIGADGTIQLEIDQKVDDIVDNVVIDGNSQPVIGTRHATSFVTVANRETIILGGLQTNNRRNDESRLGILGQIPVLGNLFSSKRNESVRRELLLFIRPTVLRTTEIAHQDAQKTIERHLWQQENLREMMDPTPPPPPPSFSDEALELRGETVENGAQEGMIGENLNDPSLRRLSPEALELRKRNLERQNGQTTAEELQQLPAENPSSLSRFPLRFRFFAIPALILAAASAGAFANVGDELVKNSPFLPEGYQPPRPPDRTPPRPTRPPEERPLDKLEFRSIAKLSGETTFSLFDPTEKRGFWLTVNQSEGGFTLVEYKEKEDSVVVRHDGRTRVIPLRESKVVAIADTPATRPAPTPTAAPAAEAANPEERMQNLAEEIRRRREIRRALIEQNEANNAQGGQNAQN